MFLAIQLLLLAGLTHCQSLPAAHLAAAASANAQKSSVVKQQLGKKKKSSLKPQRIFRRGQWDLQTGMGLLPTYLMDKAKVKAPPIMLGTSYRFSERFSLSAVVGHSASESRPYAITDDIQATWTNRYTSLSLRPAFHVVPHDDWDFYGGFYLGIDRVRVEGKTNGSYEALRKLEGHLGIVPQKNTPAFGGFTGVRHVVTPKWTISAEASTGISLLTFGVGYLIR